jgi:putative transposase
MAVVRSPWLYDASRESNRASHERSEARQDTRAGSYERTLQTRVGDVNLKIPKLRRQTFETAIIERYRRRESSVEETLIEMYLAGISVRRVEDITEALWGTRVSPSTVSNLNKKIYAKIEAWRNRRIEGEHPYLYLDGIVMKRSWAGEVRNVSLLVASAVNSEGFREILGICEGAKEDKSGWSAFLRHLVDRGLKGVQLIISDACRGLIESAADYLPETRWQRCMVHFYRNVFSHVPATKAREVSHMLKAIHGQESREAANQKAKAVIEDLRASKMSNAVDLVEQSVHETLTYYAFPDIHWHKIRTTDEMDKDFFGTSKMRGNLPQSVLLFDARATFFRPDCPSSAAARRGGQGRPASSAATARLGLDRPEHGGMLDRSGLERPDDDRRSLARLELTGTGDYCCRARATLWRRAACRLQASPGSLII